MLVMQNITFIPYKWGGDDPMGGFDCSGGIQELLASVGLDPKGDQTAQALYNYFSSPDLGCEPPSVEFGDLIFFGNKRVTHVAMAVTKTIMFEFGGGGSKTINKEQAAKHNAYGRFRAISNRRDYIKAIRIKDLEEK